MPVLFLMRHAHAEHTAPGLGDYYRPLSPSGREAAAAQAQHLAEVRYVLVSGSARTRQTVACLALGVDVEPSRDLYGAGSPTILRAIRAVPDEVAALLVVGHSPGIPSLVDQLAGPGSDAEALRLASHFPPATLCRLEVSGAWADLDRGRLTHTYRTLLPSER